MSEREKPIAMEVLRFRVEVLSWVRVWRLPYDVGETHITTHITYRRTHACLTRAY